MTSLAGRTALVTGGTSGIGHATASRLAAQGANVVVTGRRPADQPTVRFIAADMADPAACREVVNDVATTEGRLDILVNNAGTMLVGDVAEARPEDWAQMAAVNLMAATECARVALPHLIAASVGPYGCADLVFVGSLASRTPSPGRAFYAATKAAVEAFADVLRVELATTTVRVGVVLPGLTNTALRSANAPEALAKMTMSAANLATVPALAPDHVAHGVAWMIGQPPEASVSTLTILPTRQGT